MAVNAPENKHHLVLEAVTILHGTRVHVHEHQCARQIPAHPFELEVVTGHPGAREIVELHHKDQVHAYHLQRRKFVKEVVDKGVGGSLVVVVAADAPAMQEILAHNA